MPIYTYRCDCGLNFERIMLMTAASPPCPNCGRVPRKIPAGPSLHCGSDQAPSNGRISPPWHRTFEGKPERVQRELEFRQRLEARHVETQNLDH